MNELRQQVYEEIFDRHQTSSLNKKQAAQELNIGLTKLDELRKSGELRYTMIGGSVRIPASAIAEMIV